MTDRFLEAALRVLKAGGSALFVVNSFIPLERKAGATGVWAYATLEELTEDMAGLSRRLLGESQLRWVGPEKGVIHLGAAAIINAVWDLWGKHVDKPVWQLVAEMDPQMLMSALDGTIVETAMPARLRTRWPTVSTMTDSAATIPITSINSTSVNPS